MSSACNSDNGGSAGNSTDDILDRKIRKRLGRAPAISSDEDEDDEELAEDDMNFINDLDDEDDEDGIDEGQTKALDKSTVHELDADVPGTKSAVNRGSGHDEEEDVICALDDDDLDLLEENLGIRQRSRQKRRRVVLGDDEENDAVECSNVKSARRDNVSDDESFALKRDREDQSHNVSAPNEDQASVAGTSVTSRHVRPLKRFSAAVEDAHVIFGLDDDREENKSAAVADEFTRSQITAEQVYEPCELKANLLTDFDAEVKLEDVPERFKLRRSLVIIPPDDDCELDSEADWISVRMFGAESCNHNPLLKSKLRKVLELLRVQSFDLPFIASYRKEYIHPELQVEELWRIWDLDEEWCQLYATRKRLKLTLEQTHSVQLQRALSAAEDLPTECLRPIDESDVQWLIEANTYEQMNDISDHLRMYYDVTSSSSSDFSQTQRRRQPYFLFRHLVPFARRIGLDPKGFLTNLRSKRRVVEPDQYYLEPVNLAQEYLSLRDGNGAIRPGTSTVTDIINASTQIAAQELAADPRVRSWMRDLFFEKAVLDVYPTEHGLLSVSDNKSSEIADQHPCRPLMFIRKKPVSEIKNEEFLLLHVGKTQRMILFNLSVSEEIEQELKSYVIRDEYTSLASSWNGLREKAVEIALKRYLYPIFERELGSHLLRQAQLCVISRCREKFARLIERGPLPDLCEDPKASDDSILPNSKRRRFLSIDYDGSTASLVLLTPKGQIDRVEFVCLNAKSDSFLETVQKLKSEFSVELIILASQDIRCIQLRRLLNQECILCDNSVSRVYAQTKKAETEFRDQPVQVRRAVSMFRFLRDPMLEICQLANLDMDLCSVPLNPLQTHVDRQLLYDHLCRELIEKVRLIGVDINRCLHEPSSANVLQFVSGLGPRKASYLMKTIAREGQLSSRSELVTLCKMGPKVFINCAAFIKIDSQRLSDDHDGHVEFLDGTRIHPEAYVWARKMAIDGLELDDSRSTYDAAAPGATSAVQLIIEMPQKLQELDLDAFAAELLRTGYGEKRKTLYDIRSELINRFADCRPSMKPLTDKELFYAIIRESPETFGIGTLVSAQVIQIITRSPVAEDLENMQSVPKDDGSVRCPYCDERIANQLDLWGHVESQCPGIPVGVRVSFDCANQRLIGFVPISMLPDTSNECITRNIQRGQRLLCRIHQINYQKVSCVMNARKLDAILEKDPFVEETAEKEAMKKSIQLTTQIRVGRHGGDEVKSFVRRLVVHPSFRNVDFLEAERILREEIEVGDALIRPSSSHGPNFLTLSFKVFSNPLLVAYYLIREELKTHEFTIGKKLFIDEDEYEDLDEIIARFVTPMAAILEEVQSYKNFIPNGSDKDITLLAQHLAAEKIKTNRIPYCIAMSQIYPGRVVLCYMPESQPVQEYLVIRPSCVRLRNHEFPSFAICLNWFKNNYKLLLYKQPEQKLMPAVPPTQPLQHALIQNRTPQCPIVLTPQQLQSSTPQMFDPHMQQPNRHLESANHNYDSLPRSTPHSFGSDQNFETTDYSAKSPDGFDSGQHTHQQPFRNDRGGRFQRFNSKGRFDGSFGSHQDYASDEDQSHQDISGRGSYGLRVRSSRASRPFNDSRGFSDNRGGWGVSRGGRGNIRGGWEDNRGGWGDNRGDRSDYKGDRGDHRGGRSDHRGIRGDYRGGRGDYRGGRGRGNYRGGRGDNSESRGDYRGGRGDYRGGRGDYRGGRSDHRGGRSDHRGGRGDYRGGRGDHRGGRGDYRGGRGDYRGGRGDYRGGRDDYSVGRAGSSEKISSYNQNDCNTDTINSWRDGNYTQRHDSNSYQNENQIYPKTSNNWSAVSENQQNNSSKIIDVNLLDGWEDSPSENRSSVDDDYRGRPITQSHACPDSGSNVRKEMFNELSYRPHNVTSDSRANILPHQVHPRSGTQTGVSLDDWDDNMGTNVSNDDHTNHQQRKQYQSERNDNTEMCNDAWATGKLGWASTDRDYRKHSTNERRNEDTWKTDSVQSCGSIKFDRSEGQRHNVLGDPASMDDWGDSEQPVLSNSAKSTKSFNIDVDLQAQRWHDLADQAMPRVGSMQEKSEDLQSIEQKNINNPKKSGVDNTWDPLSMDDWGDASLPQIHYQNREAITQDADDNLNLSTSDRDHVINSRCDPDVLECDSHTSGNELKLDKDGAYPSQNKDVGIDYSMSQFDQTTNVISNCNVDTEDQYENRFDFDEESFSRGNFGGGRRGRGQRFSRDGNNRFSTGSDRRFGGRNRRGSGGELSRGNFRGNRDSGSWRSRGDRFGGRRGRGSEFSESRGQDNEFSDHRGRGRGFNFSESRGRDNAFSSHRGRGRGSEYSPSRGRDNEFSDSRGRGRGSNFSESSGRGDDFNEYRGRGRGFSERRGRGEFRGGHDDSLRFDSGEGNYRGRFRRGGFEGQRGEEAGQRSDGFRGRRRRGFDDNNDAFRSEPERTRGVTHDD